MIRNIRVAWLGLLCSLCLFAAVPARAATLGREEVDFLRRDLDAMLALYEQGDAEAMLGKTHPALFQFAGGREVVAQALRQALEQLQAVHLRFVSSEMGAPTETYLAGDEEICFIPRTSVIEVNGSRVRSVTFMVAIRPVGGGEWKYLDGSGLYRNPGVLQQLFPALSQDMPLPPVHTEVLESTLSG